MVLQPERLVRGVDPAEVRALGERLLGSTIEPDDAAYDAARRVRNKEFVRQPALVVRAGDALDVPRTATFARERGLPFAIRSGGHRPPRPGLQAGADQ